MIFHVAMQTNTTAAILDINGYFVPLRNTSSGVSTP
jgi:hypothetical protein